MKQVKLFFLLFATLLFHIDVFSQTSINMQLRDTSATVNSFINIPIVANTTLTGMGVLSYKLQLNFNSALLSPQGVVTTGTISNAFGTPTVNTSIAGQITIAGAGTTALTGMGNFIFLRFKVIAAGGTSIYNTGANNNYFNEGNPTMNFISNANMNCIGQPTIYISPNTALILKGQTQNFDASNGTAPYSWSSTNTSVGTITNSGLFTANQIGTTTVKATDATSNIGTSGTIEVRGYSLYIPDTTAAYNSYINIPVRVSSLNGLNILAGSFTLNYNSQAVSDVQLITTGSLLSSVPNITLNNNIPNNRLQISFASASTINGTGVLFFIRCKLSNPNGSATGFNFESAIMNETLLGITRNGYLYYGGPPSISINVPSSQLVYGDSMQLSPNSSAAPFIWTLSDSSIATISSTGLLKVKRSGIVRVSVKDANNSTSTTSNIQLYDTYLKIADTTSPIGTEVNVPVKIRTLPIGQSVYSAQGRIYTNSPTNLSLVDIITAGTGFANAAISKSVGSNYIQFAIASTTPIPGNSILFYIKCYETPFNQTGWNTGLYFQNLMLNEGTPLPFLQNGGVTTACTVAPNFIVQDTFKACGSSYVLNANSGYSSYNWSNGATSSSITVTQSGWYKCTVTNSGGCVGIDSGYVLFRQPKFTTLNATSCNSYALPWGVTVTSSGLYSYAYVASNGCDSTVSINVTIKNNSTSNTSVNICGVSNSYSWNGGSYTSSGTYSYITTNAVGCDSVAILNLSVTSTTPTVSPAITQTLLSNLCGARKYRYTATITANATGYNWILPTSVGGVSGVTLDSGFAAFSRVIIVTYASNAAAASTDSIKVRAFSGCGATEYKAAKLSNLALNVPAAATAITITPLITNVCGNRVYRYSVPSLPVGTTTVTAATGYVWEFVGSISEYATIDSGDVNSQKIVVSYTSNAAAITGDSIKFYYTSNCGNSLTKAAKLTNTSLKEPAAPSAVTITPIQTNVCGARRYRYSAPNLPAATTTAGAASGYVWNFVGSLQSTMTIDSGDLNSQKFTVTFSSNATSSISDSVRVYFTSDCGNSLRKSAKLTNTLLVAPAGPTAVTITPIQTTVCNARRYRYSAPNLPVASTTAGAASGYVWDVIGSLATTMTIDSGDLYGQRFTVTFTSNAASAAGDSVRVFYTTAGCGNSARKAAKLTNTLLVAPAGPTAITITPIQTNVCSSRKYRYSAPNLPVATTTTGAASGYVWDFVGSLQSTMTIDSENVNSQAFTVTFTSNAAAANSDSVRVYYTSGCGNTPRKAAKLTNTLLVAPAGPTAVTITPIQTTVCSSRKYRYSAPNLPAATTTAGAASGYVWDFVGSLESTMTIDSGTVNSQAFTVTFTSNAAATNSDSVRVFYTTAGCGNTPRKAAKLTNTLLVAPAGPTAVTITPIQTNVCSSRKYRYSAPNLPASTATAGAASGYVWDFVGSLQSTMTIDSGDVNSQAFTVTFTSNAAATNSDSVRVYYTTAGCGNTPQKAAKLTNTLLVAPAGPTAVTITPIQTNVCSARKYRYSAPNLPVATTTAGAASGYVWDFVGSLESTMTIDSGDVNSQAFTVTFTSNAAATNNDSVRVYYTTAGCGNTPRKAAKLTNTLLVAPAGPTAVTITPIQTTVCSARKYRYSAPNLPAATTTAGAASGYVWDFLGSLQSTMTIDSGDVNSQAFTVTFTSNAAATNNDSVRVYYTTAGCGNTPHKAAKLSNTLLTAPAAPTLITIQQVLPDVCYARKYRYIAPAILPAATTTAGAASGYLWSAPIGTVGSTGTIDSGTVTSRIITVTYTSNAAAGAGDSIRLSYTSNGCGNSAIKAQKLSNVIKTGCVPPITKTTSRVSNSSPASVEVKVYPNPTTSQFNVQVKSSSTEQAEVRVLDVTGRFIKRVKVSSNSNVNVGSDLNAGAYMLEVRQGKELKTLRVMKF